MSTRQPKVNSKRKPARNQSRQSSSTAAPSAASSRRVTAPVSNALVNYSPAAPKFKQSANSITVRHREFLMDVAPADATFRTTGFPINAARDVTFPWLAGIATMYERYRFTMLRFIYEPRCSTATTGTIVLAVDVDPMDAAPLSKTVVYSYLVNSQSSMWERNVCEVSPKILSDRGALFTRSGALPAGGDLKTYDLGNLWVCTSGVLSATGGEVFVEYEVLLEIPQQDLSYAQSRKVVAAGGGISKTNPLGLAPALDAGLLDISISNNSTITFLQDFNGIIYTFWVGTGLGAAGIDPVWSDPVGGGPGLPVMIVADDCMNGAETNRSVPYSATNFVRGNQLHLEYDNAVASVTACRLRFLPCNPNA